MANTNGPYGFRPYRNTNGDAFAMDYGELVGTVTLGDALVVDSSTGKLKIHTAAAVESIIGVAAQSGVTGDVIGYYPAGEDVVFVSQSYQSTALTQAYVWLSYEISGTTGAQGVNTSANAHPLVKVIGFHPNTTIGAYAELLVIFQKSGYTGQGSFTPGLA